MDITLIKKTYNQLQRIYGRKEISIIDLSKELKKGKVDRWI